MPWDTWIRPTLGEKINYWKRPTLDTISENSIRNFFTHVESPSSSNMSNYWETDSWGNGPATSTTATDEWNSGSGGAASGNWGGDTGVSGFNDSSAAPAGDFGVSADAGFGGDGGDTGERSQGACFNCNEGA